MPPRIHHVTIDAARPLAQARFWAGVLGYTEDPDDPNLPDDPEALIIDPAGHHPGLLFVSVPEAKTVKNRVHLDLRPTQLRDLEVDRLLDLGATLVDDHRRPDGTGFTVLAEFCVVRSAAERESPPPVQGVDTGERDYDDAVLVSDERVILESMLDWYRAGVVHKVRGVAQGVASARPGRSNTSIAGLVKHLALVEDSWFTIRFAGRPEPEPWPQADWKADRDWEFSTAVDEPIEDVVDLYELACARSRDAGAGRGLDERGARGREPFTLRFAYVHMLEETARHLGHLDILRELLDGTTGE